MKHLANPTLFRLRIVLFLLCLIPLLRLIAYAFTDRLGADPVETITRSTGTWALNFLIITLAISPARRLTGWQWLARFRRLLALYGFFYTALHFAAYLIFDQGFDWAGMWVDVGKRPFITAGFVAFVLLIPLAITSTDGMIRRLGGRRWNRLHKLAYLIAVAAVFHYLWLVKRDITVPGIYALVLCFLLFVRTLRRSRPVAKPNLPSEVPPSARRTG